MSSFVLLIGGTHWPWGRETLFRQQCSHSAKKPHEHSWKTKSKTSGVLFFFPSLLTWPQTTISLPLSVQSWCVETHLRGREPPASSCVILRHLRHSCVICVTPKDIFDQKTHWNNTRYVWNGLGGCFYHNPIRGSCFWEFRLVHRGKPQGSDIVSCTCSSNLNTEMEQIYVMGGASACSIVVLKTDRSFL